MKDKHLTRLAFVAVLIGAVFIIAFVGAGLLSGCAPQPGISTSDTSDLTITRYIDREAKVVCWVVLAGSTDNPTLKFQPSGISCLPFGSTALDLGQ